MKVTFVLRDTYEFVLRMKAENEKDKIILRELSSFNKKLVRKIMDKHFTCDTQTDATDVIFQGFEWQA